MKIDNQFFNEKQIAEDWQGYPIYESDGENYFKTDWGIVWKDPAELTEFMEATFGPSKTIHEIVGPNYD